MGGSKNILQLEDRGRHLLPVLQLGTVCLIFLSDCILNFVMAVGPKDPNQE